MIRRLPESNGNVLGYSVHGQVTQDDVEQVQAELAQAAERGGQVRVLALLDELDGAKAAAMGQDLRGTPGYVRHVERMAVVGDDSWQVWASRLSGLVADTRHFTTAELEQAWAWLRA